jgi:NAD(P)-dependent dehydrogenase (short-subunit alcohol dehydrogenase family)
MRDVTGKVAFITGGASGVGFGMAKVFSTAGMKVVIADIRQEHLDEAMLSFTGAEVHPIRLDVTDRAAMSIRPAGLSMNASVMSKEFVERLQQVHQFGMEPQEVGEKVLRAIRANQFYIFPMPEFKEELRAIFEEALAALSDEPPDPARLAFEDGRRAMAAQARAAWPKL